MSISRIRWSSLLNLVDLEFEPEAPKQLMVMDELIQSIAWLTGATGHDRRFIRCDENGAMLVANAWSLLAQVESDELTPANNTPDTYTATVLNKGVLVATGAKIVKMSFVRKSGQTAEVIYLPNGCLYWYGYSIYTVTAAPVPLATGGTSYVGIAAFN